MKKLLSINVVVALLVLFVSGQLFAEEQYELRVTGKVNEPITNDVIKVPEYLVKNLTAANNEKPRDLQFFVTGGLSNFREDVRSTVGDGAAPRFAIGLQYNRWFGLELYAETAPALSPISLLEDLEKHLNQTATSFSVRTTSNRYLGFLSKYSFDLNKGLSLVGKVGLARFEAQDTSARLKWKNEADQSLFTFHKLDGGVKGYSPVVSFGYEASFSNRKRASMELFLTQMFDDKVKNLSLSTTFKHKF